MLFSYLLLIFTLTSSVTLAAARHKWYNLLFNTDPRLTHDAKEGYRWIRLLPEDTAITSAWPRDDKYDDNIQFGTALPVSTETEIHCVSAITHFKLQRELEPPTGNQYRLRVSGTETHNTRISHEPLSDTAFRTKGPQLLKLHGYWGRSKKLLVPVSDFWKA
jgi:hypothetical protein